MKILCGCLFLLCFIFLSFSQAQRLIKAKSNLQKGVIELKNEANVSIGFDGEFKPIISAKSKVAYTVDNNFKKKKGFPSPAKLGEMISLEEDEENGTSAQPLGHSPGVGHNNPPGYMP